MARQPPAAAPRPSSATAFVAEPSPNRNFEVDGWTMDPSPVSNESSLPSSPSLSSSEPHSPPQPVAVGAHSSKNTVELNLKYQSFPGLDRPELLFCGSCEKGWSVKTEFLGRTLEVDRYYNSKQAAKEALSGQILELIDVMKEEGELTKPEKGKKKAAVSGTENYIGQLLGLSKCFSRPGWAGLLT